MWEELEHYATEAGFGDIDIKLKIHEHGIVRADIHRASRSYKYSDGDNVQAGSDILKAIKKAQSDPYNGEMVMRLHFKNGIIKTAEIDDTTVLNNNA